MKLRSKTIFLVISMLILSLVTGSVAPLAAPAEASTRTTLNGTTVETRRVGAVRGRGGVELARAASLEAALERSGGTPAGPAAVVDITTGTMLIRHDDRELFILADTRTAFLTTGIGNRATDTDNPLRTRNVTLSALPRTVGGRDLFVPFVDVVRNLGGTLETARRATLTDMDTAGPATAYVFNNNRDAVTGNAVRMIGRGATFPDDLYGEGQLANAPGRNEWIQAFARASEDVTGAAINERVGYNDLGFTTPGAVSGASITSPVHAIPHGIAGAETEGSGVGVDAVRLRLADFGGTDIARYLDDFNAEFPAIPTAKGGVAVIFNVTDTAGRRIPHLNLTADVIASIFLGQIDNWNHPSIARLNPRVTITNAAIRVNWRPDVSGTTEIFTTYLNAASRVWRDTLIAEGVDPKTTAMDDVVKKGVGGWEAADFDSGSLRTQDGAGIADDGGSDLRRRVGGDRAGFDPQITTDAAIAAALNSIGYVSYGTVISGGRVMNVETAPAGPFGVARVQNRAGVFVLPLVANVYAAGLGHGNMLAHPVNGANPGAYPITGLTWIMVERDASVRKPAADSVQIPGGDTHISVQEPLTAHTSPTLAEQRKRAAVVVDFIRWAVVEGFGDEHARNNQFAPLTPAMKREAARILDTIQRYPDVTP